MRVFGLIGILLVAGVGAYLYLGQVHAVSPNGTTPETTLNVIGVQNDLLSMANAEKRYQALNAHYASLDELRSNSDIIVPARKNIQYSIEAAPSHFRITATYSGPDPRAPKQFAIDETMAITTN